MPASYVTEEAYGPGTRMGLLAPGILRVGDIPQLAALAAPRPLVLAEAVSPQGKKLPDKQLQGTFAFTRAIYKLYKADTKLSIAETGRAEDWIGSL